MSTNLQPQDLLSQQIRLAYADGIVDVELDQSHIDLAILMGIQKIRQASDGGMIEKEVFVHLTADVQEYTLPKEVQEIRRIYRASVGGFTNGGINFSPIDAAFANIYLLQPSRSGGLSTWDFYSQFLKVTERVFASQLDFVWDVDQHRLTILRKPTADEDVVICAYVQKPDSVIITDPYSGPWLREYAIAQAGLMLAQGRGKFPSGIPGPNGNVVYNGAELKAECKEAITKLEQQLSYYITGSDGLGFIVG